MKYTATLNGKQYEVELERIDAYEPMPRYGEAPAAAPAPVAAPAAPAPAPAPAPAAPAPVVQFSVKKKAVLTAVAVVADSACEIKRKTVFASHIICCKSDRKSVV